MKKLLFFLTCIICNLHLFASEPGSSMNLFLKQKMNSSPDKSELITVLVQGDLSQIQNNVKQFGGKLISSAGDIASVRISLKGLAELTQLNGVKRIEAFSHHYKLMNDTMRMLSRVDEVIQGQSPLTQGYNGSGVVLGFIDSGIDIHHPDFQDSLGHSRIQWLWDQNLPNDTNTPQPYAYGQEFSASDIDNNLANAHTGEAEYGHGTYVAGIGAGNGNALGHFQGVATHSDIVAVSFDFTPDLVPRLSHAVEYIFTKAQQLGKPCVINVSLGDYFGSHDGLDLEAQYISNLINQQNGRVVVASAGNIGVMYPIHLGRYSTVNDTAFTWFKYNAGYPGAYIQVFADSIDFIHMRYSIGADKVTPYYEFRGATNYAAATSSLNNTITRNVTNGGNRIGIVQSLLTKNNGVYSLEVYVQPDSIDYYWRFSTTGDGHYDSWNYDWGFQPLPTPAVYPPMINYVEPDTLQSIITGIGCLDNVLTVGNYFNTDRHVDVTNTLQITATDQPRNLAANSSRGPTRDGRIKPDICAPGHHILSCGVLTQIPVMISTQPYKVALGGFHITGGGTSASAPVVAGIAALYLQMNPTASWSDVKTAMTSCAGQDQFTWGPLPNNAWGYGKADAFAMLTNCGPVNIQPILKDVSIKSYPNPASGIIDIELLNGTSGNSRISVSDLTGKVIREFNVIADHTRIDLSDLSDGIYFLNWIQNGGIVSAQKIVLSR
ncbi:MAG: S8 family peptidase [Bacteroidetes bacterium]|nr:S8 family peptidase [Bacteroidota bacterium]